MFLLVLHHLRVVTLHRQFFLGIQTGLVLHEVGVVFRVGLLDNRNDGMSIDVDGDSLFEKVIKDLLGDLRNTMGLLIIVDRIADESFLTICAVGDETISFNELVFTVGVLPEVFIDLCLFNDHFEVDLLV